MQEDEHQLNTVFRNVQLLVSYITSVLYTSVIHKVESLCDVTYIGRLGTLVPLKWGDGAIEIPFGVVGSSDIEPHQPLSHPAQHFLGQHLCRLRRIDKL